MIPLVGVPKSIAEYLEKYRELFKRQKGFETVSRFITGLILSSNKTLEGIHSQQFWSEGKGIKRRGMHHAVFEAGWKSEDPTWQGPLRVMGLPDSVRNGVKNLVRAPVIGQGLYYLNTTPSFLRLMYKRHVLCE